MPEDLGPLFEQPVDPNYLWVVIAVFSGATILLALIALLRGRLPSPFDAAGLLLIPIFTYVLGDLFVMEESKRVEFCGSCHETMSPVVASMQAPGPSLASSHYQRGAISHIEACYQCHSGYGIWGTMDAKLAGLQHMIRTATGDYEFPIKKHGSFDIESCRNCHAGAAGFRAVEAHRDPGLQQQLLAGELSCAGLCHAEAHPPEALGGVASR